MKAKKILLSLLCGVLFACGVLFVACNEEQAPEPGPESGVYYYDTPAASIAEYTITLEGGWDVTFNVMGDSKTGRYKLEGNVLTLDFGNNDLIVSSLKEDVLTLTYNDATMNFLKKIDRTVSFDSKGGSAVNSLTVVNGKTLQKPADPVWEDHGFRGWYEDEAFTKPFQFNSTVIRKDTTLYARWAAKSEPEYVISYELGYNGAENPANATTIGKMLFNVPTPERSGYVFTGWWISQYDDATKLSYPFEEETVFAADTTLFATWRQEGTKAAPALRVDANGVSWDKVSSSVTLKITGPDGFTNINTTLGATAANSYNVDFAKAPAGDYVVELTVGVNSAKVFYKNKALDAVSNLRVEDGNMLYFDKVANADNYLITIDCGNPTHEHVLEPNGDSGNYSFANCEMKPEGMTFTVYATADGFARSYGRTLVYEASLPAVGGFSYNPETGLLTWNAIEGASVYTLTIGNNAPITLEGTSYDLRDYTGTLEISVVADGQLYNPSPVSKETIEKTTLARPKNVRLQSTTLSWDGVDGATGGYTVKINDQTFTATGTSFAIPEGTLQHGQTYTITVLARANDEANNSFWSESLSVSYNDRIEGIAYANNTLSWSANVNAVSYQIKINDGEPVSVPQNNGTSMRIALTAKENTVYVRYNDGNIYSDWSSISLSANEISFDTQMGSAADSLFLREGDTITLPTSTRPGYTRTGWYNAPQQGQQFTATTFTGTEDITLYAHWSANTYTITLNFGAYTTNASESITVVFGQNFQTLPVPTIKEANADLGFIGWNASADGNGAYYTNSRGEGTVPWLTPSDATLYASFCTAFAFEEDGLGYAVKKGSEVTKISDLVIPARYNGKDVVSIAEYGFMGLRSNLKTVSIPNTIENIPETSFEDCTAIEEFNVYDAGSKNPVFYSENKTLLQNNRITGEKELRFFPPKIEGDVYEVPDGVTYIGTNAFRMAEFKKIVFPNSVKEIAMGAFYYTKNLEEIEFKDEEGATPGTLSPLVISPNAFSDTFSVQSLLKLTLPARLAEIEGGIIPFLAKFTKLQNVSVAKAKTGFKNVAYSTDDKGVILNANGDTLVFCPFYVSGEYTIPSSVVVIAPGAFAEVQVGPYTSSPKYKNGITKLTVHANVSSIGNQAFLNNTNLLSVTFESNEHASALTIGNEAFSGCTKLATITFEEEGALEGTTYVADSSCNVVSIGTNAFKGCAETNLLLVSTLRTLGDNAFASNSNLSNLDLSHISSSLTFGVGVFNGNRKLTTVNLTPNVGVMEFKSVFSGCSIKSFTVDEGNLNYESDESGVIYNKGKTTIVYYPAGLTEGFTIPATVTRIGGGVFEGASNLTTITIPATVTEIGEGAFKNCANLTTVLFDDPAEGATALPLTIGNSAFEGCYAIANIELPVRLTSIGDRAFYGNTTKSLLHTVVMNEGITTIGASAFYGNAKLVNINIPSTVSLIGTKAFQNCALTNLTFDRTPNGKTAVDLIMGSNVFMSAKFTEIELPERLQFIPAFAFSGCVSLKKVTIPTSVGNTMYNGENVRAIGASAFNGCTALSELIFTPNGTKPLSFAVSSLYKTTSLEALNLPARASGLANQYDVFEMGSGAILSIVNYYYAFASSLSASASSNEAYFASAIKEINVAEADEGTANPQFASFEGVLYTAGLKELVFCPSKYVGYADKEGTVTVSKNATTIRPGAFVGCLSVTEIIFEDAANKELDPFELKDVTTTSQYNRPFFGNINLAKITFPARLTKIGMRALASDNSTGQQTPFNEGIFFTEGCNLNEIGDYAFQKTKMSAIALPAGVTVFGATPFGSCTELKEITISLYMDVAAIANAVKGNSAQLIIPEGSMVTQSGGAVYAPIDDAGNLALVFFDKTYELTDGTFTVPANVTLISENAFKDAKNLEKIEFAKPTSGSEVDLTIGNSAFYGSGLTSITLPKRIKSLGTNIFQSCTSMTSVDFEEGYNYPAISNSMFQSCSSLASFTLLDCVTTIGSSAFSGCSKLAKFTVNDTSNLQQICANAFKSCAALTSIVIPQGVTSLSDLSNTMDSSTFSGCTGLTTVEFKGNNIKVIPRLAFNGCSKLANITIPSSVREILKDAFNGCKALKSVVFPAGLEYIGDSAFSGATALVTADLTKCNSANFNSIGYRAFYGCTALTSIFIPSSIIHLGLQYDSLGEYHPYTYEDYHSGDVFYGCTKLTTVTFGENSQLIGLAKGTFYNCTSLGAIALPEKIGWIGSSGTSSNGAFGNCTNFTLTNGIPESVKYIGKYSFQNCSNLTLADSIPAYVLSIENYAFDGCSSLGEIAFPAALTYIGNYAFRNCTNLNITSFPTAELTTFGYHAFENCTSLKNANFKMDSMSENNVVGYNAFKGCTSLTTVVLENVHTIQNGAFNGCTALKTVTLPDMLTELGIKGGTAAGSVFFGCTSLESIVLPAGVTTLYKSNFSGCTALKSVTFNGNIEKLETEVFKNCNSALEFTFVADGTPTKSTAIFVGTVLAAYVGAEETYTIPEGTTEIGASAFANNTSIKSVVFPLSLTKIGANAFQGCTGLTSIDLHAGITISGSYAFSGTGLTSVTVPAGVKFESGYAFSSCKNLQEATIFGTGTSSGMGYMFKDCTALTTVYLADGITVLGTSMFEGCTNLTSVRIPGTITTLGTSKIFYNCTSLKSVTLPAGVTEVKGNMFEGCTNLETVVFQGTITKLGTNAFKDCKKLTFENVDFSEVTSLSNYAFAGCTSLESIELSAFTLTRYSSSTYLFQGCTSLESVTFGTGVTALSSYMFDGCSSLTSLTCGSAIKIIGTYTFRGCTSYESISFTSALTTVYANAFDGWTADQTISFGTASKPSGFNASWNKNCNAVINWAQA